MSPVILLTTDGHSVASSRISGKARTVMQSAAAMMCRRMVYVRAYRMMHCSPTSRAEGAADI